VIKCGVHGTEHGSDHHTIETVFDIEVPVPTHHERLLLKNAPWKDIRAKIANTLGDTPAKGTVQQRTDRLMSAVSGAVHSLTPKARPSSYTKRWWTSDLTQLRHIYTYWRSRARSERQAGWNTVEIEEFAKGAAKQYHDAIRQQQDTSPASLRHQILQRILQIANQIKETLNQKLGFPICTMPTIDNITAMRWTTTMERNLQNSRRFPGLSRRCN
jgi:hypothetical protein